MDVDDDGTAAKRYVIRFVPKAGTSTEDVRVLSGRSRNIKMNVIAADYAGNWPDDADKTKDWDSTRVYLGSQHNLFRYITDEQIGGENAGYAVGVDTNQGYYNQDRVWMQSARIIRTARTAQEKPYMTTRRWQTGRLAG